MWDTASLFLVVLSLLSSFKKRLGGDMLFLIYLGLLGACGRAAFDGDGISKGNLGQGVSKWFLLFFVLPATTAGR
jgi:hypothetical protein